MKYSLKKMEKVRASDKRWTHIKINHREDKEDPDRITSVTEEEIHPGWKDAFMNSSLETEDGGFEGGPTWTNNYLITPEMAQFALDKMNGNNIRKISKKRVITIAGDVKGEGFCPNGDMLIVFPFYEFVDGQHRLRACVDSGIPMRMRILFGTCNPDHINTGQSRTFAQIIAGECKYPAITSGAVNEAISHLYKCLDMPEEEGWKQVGNGNRILKKVKGMMPDLEDVIETVREYDSMHLLGNVARMAGFHTLATMISPDMANLHLSHIYGRMGWDDVPSQIKLVTSRIHNDKGNTSNNQINRHRVMSGWIHTWNHEFIGHKIPQRDWGNPSMIGLASMIYKRGLFPKEYFSTFPVIYDMLIVGKKNGGIDKEDVPVCEMIIRIALEGRTVNIAAIQEKLKTHHSLERVRRLAMKMADMGIIDISSRTRAGSTFSTDEERVYGWSPYVKPHVEQDTGVVSAIIQEHDDVEDDQPETDGVTAT